MSNLIKKISISSVVAYAILLLLQIWFDLFESEIFIKITATFLVLFAVSGIVYAIRHYSNEEEPLKKKNYLN